MSIKKHPTWPGWWIIDVSPTGRSGKRERINWEGTETEAIQIEADILKKARGGPKIAPTLKELLPDFLLYYKSEKQPSTVKDFMSSWRELENDFGDMRSTYITPIHIDRFKQRRLAEGLKKRTINKNLAYLSSLVNYLVDRKLMPSLDFKIAGYPLRQTTAPLPEVPTPREVAALISQARDQQTRLIMLLLYLCGLRIGELPTVCVEKIFLERGYIYVTGKGDKERMIPIPTVELAEELAEQMEKVVSGPLFINKRTKKPLKSIRKSIISAAKAAGLTQRVYHHLFRHSYGTHCVMAGTNLKSLQEILGHVSINTTNKYVHLAGETIIKEAGKLGAMVSLGLTRPEKEKEVNLQAIVWQLPLTFIAKQLGISDVAVKKRCVKQGIELPPRGYWQRAKSTARFAKI